MKKSKDMSGKKKITYDDTTDIAKRIIVKLIEKGYLKDKDNHYFDLQDIIQDEINEEIGLDIDDNFEVNVC